MSGRAGAGAAAGRTDVGGRSICLCLIVKNEAHIVARLLHSVRPVVCRYLVCDTGSSDGTQALIRATMQTLGVAGEVVDDPWTNFGANRSRALQMARERYPACDYSLMLDADEVLQTPDNPFPVALRADGYYLPIQLGELRYRRQLLFSHRKPWRYEGVLHEYPRCDEPTVEGTLPEWFVLSEHAGARSLDPNTYRRDAVLLQQALIDDPGNGRYVFYLAQSYFDAGEYELARRYYTQQLTMAAWDQETFFSQYRLGLIAQYLDGPLAPQAIAHFLAAYDIDSTRSEPLYQLGMAYNQCGMHRAAALYLGHAIRLGLPSADRLFVMVDVYRWRVALEYAVACYWTGDHDQAIATNLALLRGGRLPEEMRPKVLANLQFSLARVSLQVQRTVRGQLDAAEVSTRVA